MMRQQLLHAKQGMALHIGFAVVVVISLVIGGSLELVTGTMLVDVTVGLGSSPVVGSLLVVGAEVFIKHYHTYTHPHAQLLYDLV